MAALPAKISVKDQHLSRAERADDIARLKHELQLSSLDYIDISSQLELVHAMQRWPLLAEFGFASPRAVETPQPVTDVTLQRQFEVMK